MAKQLAPSGTEPVLTAKEVAAILKVSVRTVRGYRRAGKLHAIRLGGNGPYRFHRASVDRFLGLSTPREISREAVLASDRAKRLARGLMRA